MLMPANQLAQPLEPAPPITGRFLLVNVAAQRARQLRKGAFPRVSDDELASADSWTAERVAMAEIRRGLVHYDIPEPVKPVQRLARSSDRPRPGRLRALETNRVLERQSVMKR